MAHCGRVGAGRGFITVYVCVWLEMVERLERLVASLLALVLADQYALNRSTDQSDLRPVKASRHLATGARNFKWLCCVVASH